METNLEKAKRKLRDSMAISGFDISNDSFLFEMLELAAKPDFDLSKKIIDESDNIYTSAFEMDEDNFKQFLKDNYSNQHK